MGVILQGGWLVLKKCKAQKNGCNLLTGQKAAKAGWRVFDSGRSGGGQSGLLAKKSLGVGGGAIRAIGRKKIAGTGGWAANWGNLQKCAMLAAQKHDTQAAKSGVIQNPPKFDLRGI